MNDEQEQPVLKITEDGSHTLFLPGMNEHYHSSHGAATESTHIFIEQGLTDAFTRFREVHILEIGFGTGLNAILSYLYAEKNQVNVQYTGIEKYPLSPALSAQLNYASLWNDSSTDHIFQQMHELDPETEHPLSTHFRFTKHHASALDFPLENNTHQVIYFDAFAPDKQPDMWQASFFQKLYASLVPGGTLVTYCAKGQFKRDLKAAGFMIETLPGPPGKREMVRGRKF